MEPEGSLLFSQESAIFPYPKPCESSPQPPILFKIHFNIISQIQLSLPWELLNFI
jgi:hypothetical protein